jgi:hypothetical protein
MFEPNDVESRRRFLKLAAGTAAVAVLVGGLPRSARADDLPHLSESDPKHQVGDTCANCQFYSGGATGFGPCQLFPGKSVSAKGWCVSHAQKKA